MAALQLARALTIATYPLKTRHPPCVDYIVAWGGLLAACLVATGARARAQTPLLAERALERRLESPVTLTWRDQALGEALTRLASLHDLPLWIDRRVDVQRGVRLSIQNEPLSAALSRLAAGDERPWGWSTLRTVVYFGPKQAADELATVSELTRQMLAKAPADVRRAWLAPKLWSIPRLAEPRTLLLSTLDEIGVELQHPNAIPHDLWPARDIAAIAPVDRAVLTLIGFDLAPHPTADGRRLAVAPIERPMGMSHEYRLSKRLESVASELAAADDGVRLDRKGSRLVVAGRWEVHELLKKVGRPNSQPQEHGNSGRPERGAEQRFTLRIQDQPVGRVIAQLAAPLNLTVTWDLQADGGDSTLQSALISCDVRDASLDELLAAVLQPAGLAFDREGDRVRIRLAQ